MKFGQFKLICSAISEATLCLLLLFLMNSPARGQSLWTLTGPNLKNEIVLLNSIDAAGVHISRAGAIVTVPFDRFLEIAQNLPGAARTGRFTLHLAGGDQLTGEPVTIHGEQIVWKNPLLGDLPLPLRDVVALTAAGRALPDDRRKEDVIVLSNGDTVRGIIAGMADGRLTVQAEGQSSDVPLGSVATVSFAATGGPSFAAAGFRVRLDDGTAITGTSPTLAGDKFSLAVGNREPRTFDAAHVTEIEQINGPLSWLSSRAPSEDIYIPFFGTSPTWPAKMNRGVDGSEIRFKDQTFNHGIGVHAFSRLSWPLDGSFAAFRTRYSIDGDGPLADVAVRILLDDKVAFEQLHFRAGVLSPAVGIDLGSAKKLTLEIDFGSAGDTDDRLNWIEPALFRHKPSADPAPATEPATAPAIVPATRPS